LELVIEGFISCSHGGEAAVEQKRGLHGCVAEPLPKQLGLAQVVGWTILIKQKKLPWVNSILNMYEKYLFKCYEK